MGVNNKYLDVIITANTYRIVETSSKPKKRGSAMITLNKIESIFKDKLVYSSDVQDKFSKLSKDELLGLLSQKSSDIHSGYTKKQSKLLWLIRKLFSKEKKVAAVHTRIENYISPPHVLPLPRDMINEITRHLGVSDLGALGQVNRQGKAHAANAMTKRAQEYGYDGQDPQEAAAYLKSLFAEVKEACNIGLLPLGGHLPPEKALEMNLRELTTHSIFYIFEKDQMYSAPFQKIKKLFRSRHVKISKVDDNATKVRGSRALILAARHGDKKILELLLQHGADPNMLAANGSPPLHFASQAGHADIVALLLQHGAKVNSLTYDNASALLFACGFGDRAYYKPNAKVVELLLQQGADPNILAPNGSSPLQLAEQAGLFDIVTLLLEHGAK